MEITFTFQIHIMPNRSCDFCDNGYKNNPGIGYYKVTPKMRIDLKIDTLEDPNYDFICGEHFIENCFDVNGRLSRDSVPTFFPYRECFNHDHTYMTTEDTVGKETGR